MNEKPPSGRVSRLYAATVPALLAAGLFAPFFLLRATVFALSAAESTWFALAAIATAAVSAAAVYCVLRFVWTAWPSDVGAMALLVGYVAFLFATVVGFYFFIVLSSIAQLCGESAPAGEMLSWLTGLLGYLAVGVWSFRRPMRVFWGWPLAALTGLALVLLVTALTMTGEPAGCFN